MKIKDIITGIAKPVAEIFKDHGKKVSSKRVFALGGGGSLIVTGLGFLNTAIENACEGVQTTGLVAGLGCIALGCAVAVFLSEKIKDITLEK